ncbi:MAG: hypothetical protein PHW73_04825 [Atribacterota bacterium]|nr:hypothetical protein [Atribacterota bacterium]
MIDLKCKVCNKSFSVNLQIGAFFSPNNYICPKCAPEYIERKKMLTIRRMELEGGI